jgi:hypothetical protein
MKECFTLGQHILFMRNRFIAKKLHGLRKTVGQTEFNRHMKLNLLMDC